MLAKGRELVYVKIYLDIVLLLCFIFNGAILSLVMYIMKQKKSFIKLLLGTTLATLYVPIILYDLHSFFHTILGKIMYSIMIIIVTLGVKSLTHVMKGLLTFYAISFLSGGMILSIHYMLAQTTDGRLQHILLYVDNIYYDEISLVVLLFGFPLTLMLTKRWTNQLVIHEFSYNELYKLTLTWKGSQFNTVGFIDSGNHLIDPLTNRPVIICDAQFLHQFFEKKDWERICYVIKKNSPEKLPSHLMNKFTIVPCKTVLQDDYLYAIKPDKLTIYTKKKKFETKNVLVGIQLSPMTAGNEYHCLLHPHLITLQPVRP